MVLQLVILQLIAKLAAADDQSVVETPLGKVRGHILTSRSGRQFTAFSGLPYAKPPIGELRFQPPQEPDRWEGIRDARENGANCMQHKAFFAIHSAEDCLYLDVFTHNFSRKAPVLVMFHGGSFFLGSKNMVKPTYLMDEDIVVVQANYRLGIFGFLTFETTDLPGNQGLKDQRQVLHWVKQNIASFGGDPDRVTITGFSAGGASVYHHIVSPLSKGLFHRAISTSGASYNPWALSPPGLARDNAQKLMTLLGCPTEPSEAIPCVMKKDAQEIENQFPKFFLLNNEDPGMIFSPTLEEAGTGGFLEGPISNWDHNPVPLITVLSSAEGLLKTSRLHSNQSLLKDHFKTFFKDLPIYLHYWASASQPEMVTNKLREYYFPGKTDIEENDFANLTKMFSDILFNHGILKGANTHKGDVYFLWFDYVPAGTPQSEIQLGAFHCGELGFMWELNIPILSNKPYKQDKERRISESLVHMVARFMENGTAIVPGSALSWKKWTPEDQNYLHLDNIGHFSLKNGLLQDRYEFWESLDYQDKFNI